MNRTNKNASVSVTEASPRPADFPLGSAESRAAARAMIEERHGEAEIVMIGLGIGPDLPVIVPPDTVAYYQAKDGSIVMEIRRHREGGRMTIFLEQAWPDGRMYRETESCFVSSLDQLRRLPHAEQGMIERLYRTAK